MSLADKCWAGAGEEGCFDGINSEAFLNMGRKQVGSGKGGERPGHSRMEF